jgi:hypothetical protein
VEVLEQEFKVATPMLMSSLGSSLVSCHMNVAERYQNTPQNLGALDDTSNARARSSPW